MILADKIINERKKLGLSQEELADQLDVSRQSVSKWESAQSTPDLNRILKMAEIFGVSTDYLLKDDMEEIPADSLKEDAGVREDVRKVSLEEATNYLNLIKETSPRIATGVSLCIGSPIPLLILSAYSQSGAIREEVAAGAGVIALLIMVAVAVFLFITNGQKLDPYQFLELKEIETAYGVDGMVKEKKANFEKKFTASIASGVVLCIVSCIPLLIASFIFSDTEKEYCIVYMVGVLLLIVAIGVHLFILNGMEMDAYNKLLQEGNFTPEEKKANRFGDKIAKIYWPIVVALYFGISFITMRWEITWLIWPIAGILFGAVAAIAKLTVKE